MKARVKATGEIIEIDSSYPIYKMNTGEQFFKTIDGKRKIKAVCLDFKVLTTEATITGWIARDSKLASNTLHFHRNEIERGVSYWENQDPHRPIGESLILPENLFPDLTWESEPRKVEITIKIKE